jgi:hypothetical protein
MLTKIPGLLTRRRTSHLCFVSTVLEQKRGKTLERLRRGLLGVALLRLGVGYHQVLDSCRQFHQHYTREFFVRIYAEKKLSKRRLYEKFSHITLMKLTPGVNIVKNFMHIFYKGKFSGIQLFNFYFRNYLTPYFNRTLN